MTALIIILAVLLFFTVLLLLPVSLDLRFNEDFFADIKVAGIKLYSVKPDNDIKNKKADTESDKEALKQGKNAFKQLKEKQGFTGALKEIFYFFKCLIKRIKKVLPHIKFRNFRLDIIIAEADAARTAVEYGGVCTAVYPVLSYFSANANVKLKNINISADFDANSSSFSIATKVSCKVIFILLAFFGIFLEYNKFKTRNELL